ncbi:hypothetical protein ABPG75_003707 [Micractinium tetrahymenae]
MVQKQFPEAIGADDFVQRVEMALHAFGFSGENSIGEPRPRCLKVRSDLGTGWSCVPVSSLFGENSGGEGARQGGQRRRARRPDRACSTGMLASDPSPAASSYAPPLLAAMVNLCRDEVTVTLKQKIDAVFGASFSTNGLGGVLTCGAVGMGAGFSHSPICGTTGKERYVFFSFPHISINSRGEVGPMSRPGRPGQSCACGALIKSWNEIRSEGLTCNCKIPGVHDAVDPEYSILKQRIARRLRHEGETDESVQQLTLTDITKVAERTISDDLEFLISKTVDVNKADYAVITGVQIHNWAYDFEDESPNLEFVAPTSAYVVVNGQKTHIDLAAMPPLTPRQIKMLHGGSQEVVCNQGGQSTLRAEDPPYAYDSKDARKNQKKRLESYISLIKEEGLEGVAALPSTASLQQAVTLKGEPARCATADNSTILIDAKFTNDETLAAMRAELESKYRQATK